MRWQELTPGISGVAFLRCQKRWVNVTLWNQFQFPEPAKATVPT